jgi:methylthioribose-1-phosphate isomerase
MRRDDDGAVSPARGPSGVLPDVLQRDDSTDGTRLEAVWWEEDAVGYVDQRLLPRDLVRKRATSVDEVCEAIATLAVRGAPTIGIVGAYGVALARRLHADDASFRAAAARIRAARPTAVNLAWAVDRVLGEAPGSELETARAIHAEQRAVDRAIAQYGLELMPDRGNVLTHCNTGPLATGGGGTALGVIIAAHRAGKNIHVYADETRPLLQGARLTMFELEVAGVPATVIADGAAAMTMRTKKIACVIVGADRIARNGDTANKIGTYGVAIAAVHHGIPFYVAAPRSTIDFSLASGEGIHIEERGADEVRSFGGVTTAPPHAAVFNPAFDVTPGSLITGIVTEYGVARPPFAVSIPELAERASVALAKR